VVPVWRTWFEGGAPLSDFTSRFGSDFTADPTTVAVSAVLATNLPAQIDSARLQTLAASAPPGAEVSLLPALPAGHLATTSGELEANGSPTQMDFNTIGTAPGNLAGGIGTNEASCPVGAQPSPVDDARRLTDVRGTVIRNPNGSVTVTPSFRFHVVDTVDLCPGNCGSDIGTINEQQATIPMSRLEASAVSGDVPFTVDFPSRAQAAFTMPPPAPPTPQDVTVAASSLFEFGSATLKPDAEAALLAELGDKPAQADLSQPFVVEGHTDSKGSDAFNLGLSQRRAQAVATLLERRFPNLAGHVTVVGLGKANPVAPNTLADGSDNPAGRRLNRRVALRFSAPGP
jgi:outer membrane protein OmpA-like peptidoglycan-associated protein